MWTCWKWIVICRKCRLKWCVPLISCSMGESLSTWSDLVSYHLQTVTLLNHLVLQERLSMVLPKCETSVEESGRDIFWGCGVM
jgi:hypothetical protein